MTDNITTNIVIQLTRLEEKLDAYLFRTTATEERVADHDIRLRLVENSSSRMVGIAIALSAAVSLAVPLFPIG